MISIEKISKSYKGKNEKKALNDLSLSVGKNEIYGLLGPNGSGKSTCINILLGFLKADEGKAIINGIETNGNIRELRKQIGYISENLSLYPYLTGLENLDYFCKLAGISYSKAELADFLTSCGLENDAHEKRTGQYSKGMRQKVGIAIASAKKATVYLLDEPASGLDPLASKELGRLLRKLANKGSSILMASHDIFRVRETCDRIGILKHGKLVKEMQASKVSTKELEKIYLNYMQD